MVAHRLENPSPSWKGKRRAGGADFRVAKTLQLSEEHELIIAQVEILI